LQRSTSYLGIFYRKLCARLGRPAGITATAHTRAGIIFHMVTTGRAYDESIFAAQQQRQRKHLQSSLRRKAAKLGYQLIPLPQTA
jgi:transposase